MYQWKIQICALLRWASSNALPIIEPLITLASKIMLVNHVDKELQEDLHGQGGPRREETELKFECL